MGRARPTSRRTCWRTARRMAADPRRRPGALRQRHQVHSPDVVVVEGPWPGERPQGGRHGDAHGRASRWPSSRADCGPVLFADRRRGRHRRLPCRLEGCVHRRAGEHAGGHGAARRGPRPASSRCSAPPSAAAAYEVGPEFVGAARLGRGPATRAASSPSPREGHALFDLPAYIGMRLASGRRRPLRRSRAVHLFRREPLLQLPAHDASRRAGLWPPDLGDRPPGVSAGRALLTSR